MASFRVVAASLLLVGSQIAELIRRSAAGRRPLRLRPQAGYGYGPMPYGAGPFNGGPFGGAPFSNGPFGGGPFNGGTLWRRSFRWRSLQQWSVWRRWQPMRGVPFMQSFDMSRPDSFNPMRPHVWGAGPQAWLNPPTRKRVCRRHGMT